MDTDIQTKVALHTVSASRLSTDAIAEVSALFSKVVSSLPYYNDTSKRAELSKYSPGRLQQLIAADVDSVQVAMADSRPVGFCFSSIDDGIIWLSWFGVSSDYRRRGVGTSLLRTLDERAKRAKAHKIWCDCRQNNGESRATLASFGYREICQLFNHWYGQDFLLWERSIA
jgi:ribosomal protein S18 acetylase RimI-like enzyme